MIGALVRVRSGPWIDETGIVRAERLGVCLVDLDGLPVEVWIAATQLEVIG